LNLYNHQIKAIKAALNRKYLLIIRSLGSGKTLIALQVISEYMKQKKGPVLLVGPAHLIQQYCDESKKWNCEFLLIKLESPMPLKIDFSKCYCISNALLRRHKVFILRQKWEMVIVDEFHHGKNPKTQNSTIFSELRSSTQSFIGMTGSPFQNGPSEFFNLISLIAGKDVRTACEKYLEFRNKREEGFVKRFLSYFFRARKNRGPVIGIKNPLKLKELIEKYVDYVSYDECRIEGKIPIIIQETVFVDLLPREIDNYMSLLRSHRKLKDKHFFEDDLDDDLISNSYQRLSDLRQCLLSYNGVPSSKVISIINNVMLTLANPHSRLLIFSNFVSGGVDVISFLLAKEKIRHATYTGDITKERRDTILSNYRNGNVRILVLSPVGQEGLDLACTTHVFIADPHYNPERTAQLIARATRSGSMIKKVNIKHFVSRCAKLRNGTIDETILRISERKMKVNNLLVSLLSA
jgi:SNF2 family DNA or RNA helicase